jgi:hypothetical protein
MSRLKAVADLNAYGSDPEAIRIVRDPINAPPELGDDFDYSTPEAEAAIRAAVALVLEIRKEQTSPLARKVLLYERTLGLAVIPVLLRRAILRIRSRSRLRGRRAR